MHTRKLLGQYRCKPPVTCCLVIFAMLWIYMSTFWSWRRAAKGACSCLQFCVSPEMPSEKQMKCHSSEGKSADSPCVCFPALFPCRVPNSSFFLPFASALGLLHLLCSSPAVQAHHSPFHSTHAQALCAQQQQHSP